MSRLTLGEARRYFTEDEMSDQELETLVEEIDTLQCQVLDSLVPMITEISRRID